MAPNNQTEGKTMSKFKAKLLLLIVLLFGVSRAWADTLTPAYENRLANAIYKAEGGSKTRHPYGILPKYKRTTPRQACINTIRSKYRAWVKLGSRGCFVAFLGSKYAPIGAKNDPKGLNRNWVKNVRAFVGHQIL